MSEPIKVGDLVMVVGSHCPGFEAVAGGVVFQVHAILGPRRFHCYCCHGDFVGLKRIDAPGEQHAEQREEELCA